MPERFVSEPIKPVVETYDPSRMPIGEPGLSRQFIWRGGSSKSLPLKWRRSLKRLLPTHRAANALFSKPNSESKQMIQIKKVESIEQLSGLKQQYIDQTTAPLDGMWLCGFVPMASHFGFYENETLVGFCCINDEGYLLQFYLCPQNRDQASLLFDSVLAQKNSPIEKIIGAFASTAEPQYLSLCLDSFSTFKVHSLMYQLGKFSKTVQEQKPILEMTVVKSEQLTELVDFAKKTIGAPEEWLTSYYTNLINRQELFGFWKAGQLLAAGESRGYDEYQTDYADLGVIVDESMRGKGLATKVLKQLIIITETKGLKPICSTEKTNIGAQKAISRAGFFAGNRIIQFDF